MRVVAVVRSVMVLGVIANLLAIIQFANGNIWVYVVSIGVLVVALLFTIGDQMLPYRRIRVLVQEAEKLLKQDGLAPSAILTFDRSSAIFGGMLSQRLGATTLYSFPSEPVSDPGGRIQVRVGRGCVVDLDWSEIGTPLIVLFHLRTGTTLKAVLEWFETEVGREYSGEILAFYATPGAARVWPRVHVVRETVDGFVPNARLPWNAGGEYNFR